jgi:hypothetical protein
MLFTLCTQYKLYNILQLKKVENSYTVRYPTELYNVQCNSLSLFLFLVLTRCNLRSIDMGLTLGPSLLSQSRLRIATQMAECNLLEESFLSLYIWLKLEVHKIGK